LEVILRNLHIIDWVVVLYVIALLLLVTARKFSDYKFLNFSRLILTDTYLKTYRDDNMSKPFHVAMVIFSLVFFPLVFQTILYRINVLKEFSIIEYLLIGFVFICFFFLKMVLQLVLGRIIGISSIIKHYVFEKQTYFAYLVFFSLLPLLFLIFTPLTSTFLAYLIGFLWVTLFVLAMILVITHFKELFFSHSLYFILYLCAFEIAPLVGAVFYLRRL